jgi:hypothetical protein
MFSCRWQRGGASLERDHYQKKALECFSAADRVRDPGVRLKLLTIAQQFKLLAAHADALDRGASHQLSKDQPSRADRSQTDAA